MAETFDRARQEALRQHALERLRALVAKQRRVRLSVVSKNVIRDEAIRQWAIGSLIDAGIVRVEIEYTPGRAATWLVLIE